MLKDVIIRNALIDDIPQIIEVEKAAWGDEAAATRQMFESRFRCFAEGVFVCLFDGNIVGVAVTERIDYDSDCRLITWGQTTDDGYLIKSHKPDGNTLFGVDLSVHPDCQDNGIGKALTERVLSQVVKLNLRKGIHGSRIPGYCNFAKKMTVEEYVLSKDTRGRFLDRELGFYLGRDYYGVTFKIIKIIPDYFPDPESLNYGVLLRWDNPFFCP